MGMKSYLFLPFLLVNLGNFVLIEKEGLERGKTIGRGAFGKVYRAKWLNDIDVAVKKLHTNLEDKGKQIFFQELSVLNDLRHPNIVTFYGACVEKRYHALVIEYMSSGSLYQLLHDKAETIPWSERLSIALQATKGINYLHQHSPAMMHCDIKSPNFLLKKDHKGYLVKVSDFGTAKTRTETQTQTQVTNSEPHTPNWTAPEIWQGKQHTVKSDIYSLGMVYWEIATNQIPHKGRDIFVIHRLVVDGEHETIPDTVQLEFATIIKKCWTKEPDHRPNCSDLLKMLNECIQSEGKLNLRSPTQTCQIMSVYEQIFLSSSKERFLLYDVQSSAVYVAIVSSRKIGR